MIAVRVRYYNVFYRATGRHEERLELPAGARVGDLAEVLARRYGGEVARHLAPGPGGLPDYLRWFHNGRPLVDAPEEQELADGDELVLLAAASGG